MGSDIPWWIEVGLDLFLTGMPLVGLQALRPVERHFSAEALRVSYSVATFHAHAERAIGALKQGCFI